MAHEHTPGPWEYVAGTEHHGPYVTSEFGSDICDCYTMSKPGFPSARNGGESYPVLFMAEMAEPNARLIAAAPDLLAALKNLVGEWPQGDGMKFSDRIKQAQAAIAKAEGDK